MARTHTLQAQLASCRVGESYAIEQHLSAKRLSARSWRVRYHVRRPIGDGRYAETDRTTHLEIDPEKRTAVSDLVMAAVRFRNMVDGGLIKKRKVTRGKATPAASDDLTLDDYTHDTCLPDLAASNLWEDSTRDTMTDLYDLYLSPLLGGLVIAQIAAKHFGALKQSMLRKKVGVNTINRTRTLLYRILAHGADEENGAVCPMPARPTKLKEPANDRTKDWSLDQIAALNTAALQLDARPEPRSGSRRARTHYVVLSIGVISGMRCGEIAALQIEDFDFEACTIHVQRKIYKTRKGAPKMGKDRIVHVSPVLIEIVRDYCERQGITSGWLFPSRRGSKHGCATETAVWRWYREICLAAGYEPGKEIPTNPHAARHTYCSRALDNGVDLNSISGNAGHATVEITARLYTHPSDEGKRAMADNLDGLFRRMNKAKPRLRAMQGGRK